MKKSCKILRVIGKIIGIAAVAYAALFAIFYFDLDGKLLYYVWEPYARKRFDSMKHKDATKMPYAMNK